MRKFSFQIIALVPLLLGSFTLLSPVPTVFADLPSGCPAKGLVDTTASWLVTATYPAAETINAEAVCIDLIGTGGRLNTAILTTNPPLCPKPAVGAGSSRVWADWEPSNCVRPGDVVRIRFRGPATVAGIASVQWRRTDLTVLNAPVSSATVAGLGGSFVGGNIVQTDKIVLLAPFIGFASAVAIATVAVVTRAKDRKAKQ